MPDSRAVKASNSSWRIGRLVVAVVVFGVIAGPTGWFVTDALEADNDFCNACHLEPGVALHAGIREDFDARPAANLAGLHAAAGVRVAGDDAVATREFRCIDCHGGTGFLGRARTKALAAKDAFWYVVGRFEEPDHMAWPLWDEDCRQCHDAFDPPVEDAPIPAFHSIGLHNVELGVACVECHDSHDTGGLEELYYLRATHVRTQCAQCHSEYE